MNKENIEKMLEEALAHYKGARYAEAAKRWKDVLAVDPFNKQAQEGIRMAELLSQEWTAGEKEEEAPEKRAEKAEEDKPLEEILGLDEILEKEKAEKSKHIPWTEGGGGKKGTEGAGKAPGAEAAAERQKPEGSPAVMEGAEQEEIKKFTEAALPMEAGERAEMPGEPEIRTGVDSRISLLLSEGEKLLQESRYSEAVDRFSRALVIDEANYRAQELLGMARGLLEEKQRAVEKKLNQGMELFDKGDFQSAERFFREILSTNPNHQEALFYIEKIEKENADLQSIPSISVATKGKEKDEQQKTAAPGKMTEQEILPGGTIKVSRPAPKRGKMAGEAALLLAKKKEPRFARIILILAPVVFVVAGFFLARYVKERVYSIFGQSGSLTVMPAEAGKGKPGAQEAGVSAIAPAPAKEAPQGKGAETTPTRMEKALEAQKAGTLSPAQIKSGVATLLQEGRGLLRAGKVIEAEDKFKEAAVLDPLNFEAKKLLDETSRVAADERKYVSKMNDARKCFGEGNFAEALRIFYRLPAGKKDPALELYMINSWYNLGVSNLKVGNLVEAKNCFNEALGLSPSDSEARKEKEFTEWYLSHQRDSSFLAHIDSLSYRKLTD